MLYFLRKSGSNSVVECNLAKVEVAGSNPVSRSSFEYKQGTGCCPRGSVVEHFLGKEGVTGSIPVVGSTIFFI